jgi:hypothetical protein
VNTTLHPSARFKLLKATAVEPTPVTWVQAVSLSVALQRGLWQLMSLKAMMSGVFNSGKSGCREDSRGLCSVSEGGR